MEVLEWEDALTCYLARFAGTLGLSDRGITSSGLRHNRLTQII
jgi:hypothetical protein